MLKKIGVEARLASQPNDITDVDKLILPGVGSFDTGMNKLRASGLVDSILEHASIKKKPILGICLGMQMLGFGSEEGDEPGLALIPFKSVRFQFDEQSNLKIPHMGWDRVTFDASQDLILGGLEDNQRYYFVHSYHAVCDSEENVLMRCDYGYNFAAAVRKGNIYGFQFHPEKSHNFGMRILENYARRV